MPRRRKSLASSASKSEPVLFDNTDTGGVRNLGNTFRRLYYFLYSNSNASRAERLLENLSLILLTKYSFDTNGGTEALGRFMAGKGSAAELLAPQLLKVLPKNANWKRTFSLDDSALRSAFGVLADVDLSIAPAHVLGEAFQALIGPRLRGDKGQFFTPRSLVRAMVEIAAPQPHESVLDPACGTGGFLGETHIYQLKQHGVTGNPAPLVGIDKDSDLAWLATALLYVGTGGRANIYNANSLDADEWPPDLESVTSEFDVILTNPPFGTRIAVEDSHILSKYDLGHNWVHSDDAGWTARSAVMASQDPQVLFIELCVRKLRPNGRLGIVLPEGVFGNRQQGYVWTWLRRQGKITALLDCPRTTFQPGTDTKTNVLFFLKGDTPDDGGRDQKVRIAVAIHCGHDRRGRTHLPDGRKHPDDFADLGGAFHQPGEHPTWKTVCLSNRDYLVPRYYVHNHGQTNWERDITEGARVVAVGELLAKHLLTMRKGNEVGSDAYGAGDIPFVRTSDINNFEISFDPTKSVSEEVYEKFRRQQRLKPSDILMVVDGRYRIGSTAMLTENNHRCVVQSHFRIIGTPEGDHLDPYELLFALNLPFVRMRIRDLVFVQSTLGTLGKRILELEIPLLHGPGPWEGPLAQFRSILQGRDRLLADLRGMTGPEYDL